MRNDESNLIGAAIILVNRHLTIDLNAADFISPEYGKIWQKMQAIGEIDVSELISCFLDCRELIEQAVTDAPSSLNMVKAAARIKESSHRLKVSKSLEKAHSMIRSGGSLHDVAVFVNKALDGVSTSSESKHVSEYMIEAYRDIEQAYSSGKNSNFDRSGIEKFDAHYGGLQKNGLIIVSARAGGGKTSLAAKVAANIAKEKPVLIISMEMSGKLMANRYYSMFSGVGMGPIMDGDLNGKAWGYMATAQHEVCGRKIYINDKTHRNASDVAAEARRFKRQHGDAGLVVVDYLTLMDQAGKTEIEAITIATRTFKLLAGDIGCPVMLLAQMNRKVEDRSDSRPRMSDLRGCGSIEQDADQIIMPERPESNKDDSEKGAGLQENALLHVVKNRNGNTGKMKIVWLGSCATYMEEEEYHRWVEADKHKANELKKSGGIV